MQIEIGTPSKVVEIPDPDFGSDWDRDGEGDPVYTVDIVRQIVIACLTSQGPRNIRKAQEALSKVVGYGD